MKTALILPMLTLIALTFCICAYGAVRRVREIRVRRIPVQSLASAQDTARTLQDNQVMDNFNNLLQVPILFYVLCLAVTQAGVANPLLAGLAWLYVVLRTAHSGIQITHNRVFRRFQVWMGSNLVLLAAWFVAAPGLVGA